MENLKEYKELSESNIDERIGISILPSIKVYNQTKTLLDSLINKIKNSFNVDENSALESIKNLVDYVKADHNPNRIKTTHTLRESMSYTDFFGKIVTHKDAFRKRLEDEVIGIITDEKGISEKAFGAYDNVINMVRNDVTEDICEEANEIWLEGKRIQYIGEMMYDKYFKK